VTVARKIVFLLAAFLLAATALDCLAQGQIGDEAMECCRSMPCAPANQNHDCCKKMVPASGTYFLVPARTFASAASVQVLALVTTPNMVTDAPLPFALCSEARQHAPPAELSPLCQPLRI